MPRRPLTPWPTTPGSVFFAGQAPPDRPAEEVAGELVEPLHPGRVPLRTLGRSDDRGDGGDNQSLSDDCTFTYGSYTGSVRVGITDPARQPPADRSTTDSTADRRRRPRRASAA